MDQLVAWGVLYYPYALERATVTVEWFGPATFGARSGAFAGLTLLARAASPIGVEALRGRSSYAEAFAWLVVVLVAAAAIFAAGGPVPHCR